jgi:glycosyltransferase involved in cell wall biosynthesis
MHKTFIQKFTSKEPVVIYNPIDYVPQPTVKNKVPHIGFIGRLVSLKGVDILIQALKQLEDRQWTCTIVGEGDQREKLEKLVQQL